MIKEAFEHDFRKTDILKKYKAEKYDYIIHSGMI